MGSNGNRRLNQLSHTYIHILQLQWTPMGSHGNQRLIQLNYAYIHNLQLQRTPIGSNGNHCLCTELKYKYHIYSIKLIIKNYQLCSGPQIIEACFSLFTIIF